MEPNTPPEPARDGTPAPAPFRLSFPLFALALVLSSAGAATALARWMKQPAEKPPEGGPAFKFPARAFRDWTKKPDFVIAITGQQMGYLLPCGCSEPQIGGLERRYNLFEMMRAAGWPVVPVDLGDLPQKDGPAGLPNQQALIKYRYSMMAMKKMGYAGVGLGEIEAGMGLFDVLAEHALNDPSPRVVPGNLIDADKNFPDMTKSWWYADVKSADLRVGVTSVVGPTTAQSIKALVRDPKVRFAETAPTLDSVWKQMDKGGVSLPVLLYQGPATLDPKKGATEATACAIAYPQFPIVVHLQEEDEPSFRPQVVTTRTGTKSLLIGAGRKGKFIVFVGVWKTGKPATPFEYKYERVEMTTDFVTPKAEEKGHPITELMEQYAKELKEKNYLERYGQVRHNLQVMPEVKGLDVPGKPRYVGSQACKGCHKKEYKIWEESGHAHAYQTLVDAKRPGNRQYDPECIVCHTVGFGYETGFVTVEKTAKLKDVGCESCHGPSSLHVANKNDPEWQKRINPWRHLPAANREAAIDQMCQKCHDIDNDVHWIDKGDGKGGGFKRKWPKVAHYAKAPPKPKAAKDEKGEKRPPISKAAGE